MNPISR